MPGKKEPIIIHGICQCESCKKIRKGKRKEVIYLDPPYHGVSNLYGTKAWTDVDFVKLRNHFHLLAMAGYTVILSMSDTELIRELFKGYNIREIEYSSGLKKEKTRELLITNLYDEELKNLSEKAIKTAGMVKVK